MKTLWDFLAPVVKPLLARPAPRPAPARPARAGPAKAPAPPHAPRPRASAQDRYDAVVRDMLARYDVKVRKWRTSSSGVAWENLYRDGSRRRFIESPRPKGPMSMAIFLHEIGHHAIGLGVHTPRCYEEFLAWKFSLEQMEALGLNITDAVRTRRDKSLRYAVAKARRRGIKALPEPLAPWA